MEVACRTGLLPSYRTAGLTAVERPSQFSLRLSLPSRTVFPWHLKVHADASESLQQNLISEPNGTAVEPKKTVRKRKTAISKKLPAKGDVKIGEIVPEKVQLSPTESTAEPSVKKKTRSRAKGSSLSKKETAATTEALPDILEGEKLAIPVGVDTVSRDGGALEPAPVKRRRRKVAVIEDDEDEEWLDEYDTGWGFNYSDMFSDDPVRFMPPDKATWGGASPSEGEEETDDELALWMRQDDQWEDFSEVRELTASLWEEEVLRSTVPVLVCVCDRYGPQREAGETQAKEVELAAKKLWELEAHLRVLTLDGSTEPLVARALGVQTPPALILANLGKIVFRTYDSATAEDVMDLAGHYVFKGVSNATVKRFANELTSC